MLLGTELVPSIHSAGGDFQGARYGSVSYASSSPVIAQAVSAQLIFPGISLARKTLNSKSATQIRVSDRATISAMLFGKNASITACAVGIQVPSVLERAVDASDWAAQLGEGSFGFAGQGVNSNFDLIV